MSENKNKNERENMPAFGSTVLWLVNGNDYTQMESKSFSLQNNCEELVDASQNTNPLSDRKYHRKCDKRTNRVCHHEKF